MGFTVREGLKEAEVGRSTQNKELDVVAFEAKTEVLLRERKECSLRPRCLQRRFIHSANVLGGPTATVPAP